ncbi:MAG: methyltransferase domain-containing protein [SAR202 cluster bacterium]|nr:methyltransferase domain-containing protein [SAR202 cluster bacterium]
MTTTDIDQSKAEGLTQRTCNGLLEAMDLLTIYLGDRLGLYRALAEGGSATPGELAERAGIHERYAREWLEQQAVTGILDVSDAAAASPERRYALSAGHAATLADPMTPFPVVAFAQMMVAVAGAAPKLVEAYRTGGGVPWAGFGPDLIAGQGGFNRGWLLHELGTKYMPGIPDVHARLLAGPPARVADIACGVGWSSIGIAKAYPRAQVVGYDLDAPSIEQARLNAEREGVADRVRFEVADASQVRASGTFDVVVIIEAVHDVPRPVELLSGVRRLLAPGGAFIVADEKVADSFSAPGDFMERLFYGASALVCLPSGMAGQPSAATGAVMRRETMEAYARQAGFTRVEVLPLDHPSMRFYRLYAASPAR